MHQVLLKPSVAKSLDALPSSDRRRILEHLEALKTSPRPPGVVKMAGDENLWRIRVGVYRIIYEIHDRQLIVLVLAIGHRRDIYRRRKQNGGGV